MESKIKIELGNQVPVYKQLIHEVQNLVNSGEFRNGDFIPSMNELSSQLNISKETVKKAYSILRNMGIVEAAQGKGFYIMNNEKKRYKILLLFDKISAYKQVLFSSFSEYLGECSEVTIRLHNQDIVLFEQFIEENLDKFDYYIITAHLPLQTQIKERVIKTLKKIPNRKLILLDRHVDGLPGNFGSVFQDFERDIYDGLTQGINVLREFKKLNVISMPGSLYAPLIEKGIKKFCSEFRINFEIHKNLNSNIIQNKEVYLILNSQLDSELIEIVKIARLKDYEIGKDIGIISYNESPINEIILDGLTVFSTDFKQMGELAAKMILDKSFRKIRCNFKLIRRNTF